MKSIYKKYTINAPISEVWKALVDTEYIEGWGAGKAHMDDTEGYSFTLWDGSVHGTNIEVVEKKKLVQEWYGGDWEKPSKVQFLLFEGKDGSTKIQLVQDDVPDNEEKDIDEGWDKYYLGAIKQYLEEK
jgi:activator of HSP90 ATPase